MKTRNLILPLVFVMVSTLAVFGQQAEMAAVRVPLENYIQAHATGDPAFARKAFYTEGNMTFVRDGKIVTESLDAFITRAFTGKPASDEAQRKRRIGSIEIVGTAAVATVILEYPAVKFTDFMTLLKFNGEWKIVNKSFYAEPKAMPELKKN